MSEEPPQSEYDGTGSGGNQVDALKLFAYSRAIPGAPKPRLKLPGDNIYVGGFAKAFWTLIRQRGVFRRDVHTVLINEEARRLDFVEPDMLVIFADDHVEFFKTRAIKNGDAVEYREVGRSMTPAIGKSCLAQVKVMPGLLCEVEKVNFAPMPTRREDGRLDLLQPGYDVASKTFTFDCGFTLDETMTLAEARAHVDEILKEFPFGDGMDDPERSRAVQVACMLTLFAGGILPRGASRPIFIFNANAPRSGKSLLAKMALMTVFGTASSASWSENKEEFRKALETAANTAVPYIFYDNVRMHMANADLERFVTSPDVTCRVMGKNTEQITVPNVATVLITANQATTSPDISERALFVNLFVTEADAQERRIESPMDEVVLSNPERRRKMLSALWAMIRHWQSLPPEQQRPHDAARRVGFEEWSAVVGGIVRAAGFACPLSRPKIAGMGDNRGQQMESLVKVLWTCKVDDEEDVPMWDRKPGQGRAFTFQRLCTVCSENGLFDEYVPDEGDMKPSERSKFGKFLKKYLGSGRTFAVKLGESREDMRLVLRQNGEEGRAKRFIVEPVAG